MMLYVLGDFCLLFQTLTLTNGALMQVKLPLSDVARCFGMIYVLALVGGHIASAAFRVCFCVKFVFIIVDLCVSILLPVRHL